MSTAIDLSDGSESLGFPELTPLGKQIEVLRIGRGMSKQHLARYAGTSRQQLWRVMTGKTELTGALRARLAEALRVPESALVGGPTAESSTTTSAAPMEVRFQEAELAAPAAPLPAAEYLTRPDQVERTLRTMPNGGEGRELKRAFLNALEDLALEKQVALTAEFFELRRRVLADEL